MARTRLIKPDFFTDPDLADCTLQARMTFAGLWCQADRDGRLKYEPRKLKVLIFPFDKINMEKALEELTKKPFIKIYSINDISYIQIINWDKHQSPHGTEKDSEIPPFNGCLTVKEPLSNEGVRDAPFSIRHQVKVSELDSKFKYINNEDFKKAFEDYLDMRKKQKKSPTERAKEMALELLHSHPIDIAIKMLNQSVMNSWQGIFEIKKERTSSTNLPSNDYDKLIESRLGKLATKDMIKKLMIELPENFWWKVDAFLKKRYPGGGNGFGESERELKKEQINNGFNLKKLMENVGNEKA